MKSYRVNLLFLVVHAFAGNYINMQAILKSHQVNIILAGFNHLEPLCCCRRCSSTTFLLLLLQPLRMAAASARWPPFRSQRRAASLCTGKRSPKPSWPAKSNTYNSTVQKRGAKHAGFPSSSSYTMTEI